MLNDLIGRFPDDVVERIIIFWDSECLEECVVSVESLYAIAETPLELELRRLDA